MCYFIDIPSSGAILSLMILSLIIHHIIRLAKRKSRMSKKNSKPPPNNKLITNFFTNCPPSEIRAQKEKKTNPIVEFYDVCLESGYDQGCQLKACADKKEELRKQFIADKARLEQIKRAQATANIICAEKDDEISILQSQVESAPSNCAQSSSLLQAKPFTEFAEDFTEQQIHQIRSVGNTKTDDSTFVLEITRALYANNIDKLQSVTVTGRSKDKSKQPVSPEKMRIFRSMFSERFHRMNEKKTEIDSRKTTLNNLINRAISNINKPNKSKSNQEQIISKINLHYANNSK